MPKKRSAAPPLPSLPPYGFMDLDLMDAMAGSPFPEGFQPPAGQTPEQAWQDLYVPMVDRLAACLWARWRRRDEGGADWDGRAVDQMWAMTLVDFELLEALQPLLDEPVRQQAGGGIPVLASTRRQREFFRIEDRSSEPVPVQEYLSFDDRIALQEAAAEAGLGSLQARVGHWMSAHSTAPTLPAKNEIQRPRPYQVASLLGRPAYGYQFAEGAVTSALPSGHCIQGLQGVCAAYLEFDAIGAMTPQRTARLRQYAVDMGDRRVMAGVHYPSDNLASWCIALYLCDALYAGRATAAREFLARAIVEHSVVYRQLLLQSKKASVYDDALAWLGQLIGSA